MDAILLDAIEYNGGGINALLNKGVVKSVQTGFVANAFSGANQTLSVDINAVNVDKSIVIVNTEYFNPGYAGSLVYRGAFSFTLYTNRLDVTIQGANSYNSAKSFINWQIIEFY